MSQLPASRLQRLPHGIESQLNGFRRSVRRVKLAEAFLAASFGLLLAYLIVFGIERFVELLGDTEPSF